jgi:hypothetical protein
VGGTLTAQGLDANGTVVCTDQKVTAGNPDHIALSVAAPIVNPATGETFKITANGSDAAFILATVVDASNNWCPTASNNITFNVSGPANYRGGADQMIGAGGANYHSPGDHELSAEGGMCKVAIRSTFTPGTVTVTATSGALSGTTSFTVYPVPLPPPVSVRGTVYAAEKQAIPSCKVGIFNGSIRYFIGQPANLSMDIIDAGGKIVEHSPTARVLGGWHDMRSYTDGKLPLINGVYFVRCSIDGYRFVKRVLVVK